MTYVNPVDRERKSVKRQYGSYREYLRNEGWSYPYWKSGRAGVRRGYLTKYFGPVSITASVERNYPCRCWQSWFLLTVSRHWFRITFGNHDAEAEEFRSGL